MRGAWIFLGFTRRREGAEIFSFVMLAPGGLPFQHPFFSRAPWLMSRDGIQGDEMFHYLFAKQCGWLRVRTARRRFGSNIYWQRLTKFAICDTCLFMATMNISLPDAMKNWVEAQTASGRYSNSSDVVRDLIRREQERADKIAAMRQLVDEGRASGLSEMSMEEILASARAKFIDR